MQGIHLERESRGVGDGFDESRAHDADGFLFLIHNDLHLILYKNTSKQMS